MSRTEELRERIQAAHEYRDDEALATLTPQLDALTAATTDAVAGLVVHAAQAAPAPVYTTTLPALEDEFRRNSRWYAKIFCNDALVKTIRAETERKCSRETANELHRLQHPQATLADPNRAASEAITEARIEAQRAERKARRTEWREAV